MPYSFDNVTHPVILMLRQTFKNGKLGVWRAAC